MLHPKTLEEMLCTIPDNILLDIYMEIYNKVIPATGHTHTFCRCINSMIDSGEMCVNPSTYRKVYLPTLVKAVQYELSRRYVILLYNKQNK